MGLVLIVDVRELKLIYYKKNAMFTIFSQQIKSGTLLRFFIDGQKNNFSNKFKLESIII